MLLGIQLFMIQTDFRAGANRDSPDLSHAACAGDARLRDIECAALKQILEIEPSELVLPEAIGIVVDRRTSACLA